MGAFVLVLMIFCIIANISYFYISISTAFTKKGIERLVLTIISVVGALLVVGTDVNFWAYASRNGYGGETLNIIMTVALVAIVVLIIVNAVTYFHLYKNRA